MKIFVFVFALFLVSCGTITVADGRPHPKHRTHYVKPDVLIYKGYNYTDAATKLAELQADFHVGYTVMYPKPQGKLYCVYQRFY